MKRLLIVLMLLMGIVLQNGFAEERCGGVFSPGNPYPCCRAGNCTWWAWAVAADGPPRAGWSERLPGWGNAGTWLDAAQRDGQRQQYGIRFDPAPNTIAVSTTGFGDPRGHVAWVNSVLSSDRISVTEMMCDVFDGWRLREYDVFDFDGFIYPRPKVTSMNPPNPIASDRDQLVILYGSNFQTDPVTEVLVTFPDGGQVYLSGDPQVRVISDRQMNLLATFGSRGQWRFQVWNADGANSDEWVFNVN